MARDVSPPSLMPLSARYQERDGTSLGFILPSFPLRFLILYYFLSCAVSVTGNLPGIEYDYGISPKFVCTPIPPEADPSCYSPPSVPHGPSSNGQTSGHNGSSRRGVMSDEAKATILHLRESLVRQKETILDQRETIRELTAKLTLCEGFGGHHGTDRHDNHHENHHDTHHDTNHHDGRPDDHRGHHGGHHTPPPSHHGPSTYHSGDHHHSHGGHRSDPHPRKAPSYGKHSSFSPEQTGKTLQTLKERLENLQARNSSSSYSSSLRELLQRKITALEEQLDSYYRDHHDDHRDDHHDDHRGGSSHPDDHHDDRHDDHHDDHRGNGRHDDRHDDHHDDHRGNGRHDDHHDDHHGNSRHNDHHDDHHGTGHRDNHHYDHRGTGRRDDHHDDHRGNGHHDDHHGSYHSSHHGSNRNNHRGGHHSRYNDHHYDWHHSRQRSHHGNHHSPHHDEHHDDHHGYYDDHHDGHHHDHHDDHHNDHYDDHHDDHRDNDHHDNDHHDNDHQESRRGNDHSPPHTNLRGAGHGKLETVLSQLHHGNTDHDAQQKPTAEGRTRTTDALNLNSPASVLPGRKLKTPNAFLLNFPVKTNYMYAKMKRPPVNEIFALTICLWLKAGAGPGLGTPFSYAAPGQANELVLIEWGSNPMELLICDKAVTLPITMTDGKWHHVCITWTTRDGVWEAYQDGVKKGSGQNLSAWRPIEPGGAFILGQEQDTMGGRFDVTQSFVGELSDLQFWSRVLSASEISTQATCGGHLVGDVMSWSEESVELHGGLVQVPFDPCH
ncbi:uncharacterized protein LOC120826985 isoform X2 [Gasterosteus aculeatus]